MANRSAVPKRSVYALLGTAGVIGFFGWLLTDIGAFLIFPVLGLVVAAVVRFAVPEER